MDNFEQAALFATRSAEMLSALPRGNTRDQHQAFCRKSDPTRQLCIPARQIAKQMAEAAEKKLRQEKHHLLGDSGQAGVCAGDKKKANKDKKKAGKDKKKKK
jgi:hypothetical protein